MTAAQFRELRIAAGFQSQQAAADFLHRSLRTIHGWENGEPIDEMAVDYLGMVAERRGRNFTSYSTVFHDIPPR